MDHPVVAVTDLEASRETWERLGFTVPPRGSHVEWGTGNLCIMFPDDYIEMRGIIDAERFTMHLDEHLERMGEGLMGVAFRTDDVHASFDGLTANGVAVGEPRRLTRNFEHPEGWTQPSFELCVPEADAIEGLMHVVVLQHLTPELIRRPDFLQHANSAIGVNSLSGVIEDTAAVASKMRRLLGEAAVSERDDEVMLTIATGQTICLFLLPKFIERFGALYNRADGTRLGAMEIAVQDIAQARQALSDRNIAFKVLEDQTLRVNARDANGVVLDFCAS